MPFQKSANPRVNAKTQLGVKLIYYDVAVQYISHFTMVTPLEMDFDKTEMTDG